MWDLGTLAYILVGVVCLKNGFFSHVSNKVLSAKGLYKPTENIMLLVKTQFIIGLATKTSIFTAVPFSRSLAVMIHGMAQPRLNTIAWFFMSKCTKHCQNVPNVVNKINNIVKKY